MSGKRHGQPPNWRCMSTRHTSAKEVPAQHRWLQNDRYAGAPSLARCARSLIGQPAVLGVGVVQDLEVARSLLHHAILCTGRAREAWQRSMHVTAAVAAQPEGRRGASGGKSDCFSQQRERRTGSAAALARAVHAPRCSTRAIDRSAVRTCPAAWALPDALAAVQQPLEDGLSLHALRLGVAQPAAAREGSHEVMCSEAGSQRLLAASGRHT